jgi:hypothetical protein
MPSDATDGGVRDPQNDLEVLVPQWEWCHKDEREHDSIGSLAVGAADWGVYGETQNSEIETAFQAGHSMLEVALGIRIYHIIFDFEESGMVQRDHKWGAHCALRAVRRRLVNLETRAADLRSLKAIASKRFEDETCAVCMQAFADTPTMPVASLPGCGHHFHTACTQRLADQQSDCPFCRTKVDWNSLDNYKSCHPCTPSHGDRDAHIADQQKHKAPHNVENLKALPNAEENFIGIEAAA